MGGNATYTSGATDEPHVPWSRCGWHVVHGCEEWRVAHDPPAEPSHLIEEIAFGLVIPFFRIARTLWAMRQARLAAMASAAAWNSLRFKPNSTFFYSAQTDAGPVILTAFAQREGKALILDNVAVNYSVAFHAPMAGNVVGKMGARRIRELIKSEIPRLAKLDGYESVTYRWVRTGFGSTANAAKPAVELTVKIR